MPGSRIKSSTVIVGGFLDVRDKIDWRNFKGRGQMKESNHGWIAPASLQITHILLRKT